MLIQAKMLRNISELNKIPNDRSGWYRWWAKETEIQALLDSRFLTQNYFDALIAYLPKGTGGIKDYRCIYIGVAVKESIRARLNWHVNQHHAESAVMNGTLSTLRQTLSSLIAGDQRNESATNDFIDKLVVEYFPVEYLIKSPEAKKYLENNEEKEISECVLILNIKSNKRQEVKDFSKELSKLRSSSKKGILI